MIPKNQIIPFIKVDMKFKYINQKHKQNKLKKTNSWKIRHLFNNLKSQKTKHLCNPIIKRLVK